MMYLKLPKVVTRRAKRLGQGPGSGKGKHTVGRGQKGQKTRGKIPVWFEGGQLPLIRRTPFVRGKRRFQSLNEEKIVVTLTQLNKFDKDATVDLKSLVSVLKISSKKLEWAGAKIVANGKLEKSLKVSIPTTASAKSAIEKAGGSVVI